MRTQAMRSGSGSVGVVPKRIRRVGPVAAGGLVLASSVAFGLAPVAAAEVTGGDGGIVEQPCGESAVQVRVDSADAEGGAECFGLVAPSGWISVNISGSYGVVNHLLVPVTVSFKLPTGAVYWSTTVQPGQVKTIDVNRSGSTVVELQVSPVASPSGPSTGTLTPAAEGEQDTVTSLRSAVESTSPRVLQVTWSGVGTGVVNRNSDFNERLDASFVVRRGLSNGGCVSLESAATPGVFLRTSGGEGSRVVATVNPDPAAATWCPATVTVPPSAVRLMSAADPSLALAVSEQGEAQVVSSRVAGSVWFVDQGLARPVAND